MLRQFVHKAKNIKGAVFFAEGDEERTLEAAVRLVRDEVCRVIVTAQTTTAVERLARRKKLDISGLRVMAPSLDAITEEALQRFVQHQVRKGFSEKHAREVALTPLNFAALATASGAANSLVAGARADTSDVLRAAIHGIGSGHGTRLLSSFFLMLPPAGYPLAKGPLLYADCAVNPDPGAPALCEIARATINSFKLLFPSEKARVAFLSFSTKGSAEHSVLQKIRQAAAAAQKNFQSDSGVLIDGEMQFDAAIVPAVAARKAPGSPVGGAANILIFPDLNSANICYKMTERLGRFRALGPVLQGVRKPVSDLSRGCSVDDIYYVAVLTLLQSANG